MTTWFTLNIDSKEFDVSSWINPDGTINIELLQKEIAEDLEKAIKETKKWQERAIQFSVPTN